MAETTALNSQMTDAVTQTNVGVIAESPAVALASQILSLSHAHALMAYNAVSDQHHDSIVSLAGIADKTLWDNDSSRWTILSSKVSSLEQSLTAELKNLETMVSKLRSNTFS